MSGRSFIVDCDVCGRSFYNPADLKEHRRVQHSGRAEVPHEAMTREKIAEICAKFEQNGLPAGATVITPDNVHEHYDFEAGEELMDIKDELAEVHEHAMESLRENQLDNVCDTAYALNPKFTPNYSAIELELSALAGYQVRICGNMCAIESVPYRASREEVHAATRKALRVLMVGMREQAQKWLDENPE